MRGWTLLVVLAGCDPNALLPGPGPVFVDEDGCPEGTDDVEEGSFAATSFLVGGVSQVIGWDPEADFDFGEAPACVSADGAQGLWRLSSGGEPVGTLWLVTPGAGTYTLPDAEVVLEVVLEAPNDRSWLAFEQGALEVEASEDGLQVSLFQARASAEEDGLVLFMTVDAALGGL